MNLSRRESGQTTVMIVGMTVVALAVVGFAIDGTRAFLMRRTLQNAADAAATAGSSELDQDRYYASGGRILKLDPQSAERAAARWLASRSIDAKAQIDGASDGVTVVLRGEITTTFLGVVGIRDVPVAVSARAEPVASEGDG